MRSRTQRCDKFYVGAVCAILSVQALAHESEDSAGHFEGKVANELDSKLLAVRNANRTNVEASLRALATLASEQDLEPLLIARYEATPAEDYSSRRFLLSILGEFQDPRALSFFVSILSQRLPATGDEPDVYGAADEEETVHVKAIHAIGYMRTDKAKRVLLDTMIEHESFLVRAEAVSTFMWNSHDKKEAAQELYRVLPASLQPFVEMPRFHRGMDSDAFDRAVAEWRKKWAKSD